MPMLRIYNYFEYLLTKIPKDMDDYHTNFCEDLLPRSDCRLNAEIVKDKPLFRAVIFLTSNLIRLFSDHSIVTWDKQCTCAKPGKRAGDTYRKIAENTGES